MLKKPKSFLILSVTTFLISLASGAFVSWLLLKKQPLEFLPNGVELIPDEAVFVASLSTDSQQWQQLQQIGKPEIQKILQQPFNELEKSFHVIEINFLKDIKPWLEKEITIAYLENFYDSQKILILPIASLENFQKFWNDFESKASETIIYQTLPIYQFKANNNPDFFITRLNNYAVVASDTKTLKRVIDTYQGDVSLLALPGLTQSFAKIQDSKRFAHIYMNLPATSELMKRSFAQAEFMGFSDTTPQKIATTVTLSKNKVQLSTILWNKPTDKKADSNQGINPTMLRSLPNNTRLVLAGGNTTNFWNNLVKESQSFPIMPIQPEQIQAFIRTTTGLEWEKDFLPWMNDNFAVALVPSVTPDNSILEGAFVFMVEVTDRDRAKATLENIHSVLESRYQFQRDATPSLANSETTTTNWTSPLGGVTVTEGWLSQDTLFFTLGAPVTSSYFPLPQTNLPSYSSLHSTLKTSQSAHTQLFLDLENLLTADSGKFLELSPQQQSWLKGIHRIGLTTTSLNRGSHRIDMTVELKSLSNHTGKQPER